MLTFDANDKNPLVVCNILVKRTTNFLLFVTSCHFPAFFFEVPYCKLILPDGVALSPVYWVKT